MSYHHVKIKSLSDAIVLITLNRPEKRNALNLVLMEELSRVFEELQTSSFRVAILNAEGASFCTGLDLHEVAEISLAEQSAMLVARLLTAVYTSSLVTIASVQGDAIAGGAGLVAACDIAIAAPEARIGFPEIRRGLVAALVATLLCRQMPMRAVRELLLLGELVDSATAHKMGLFNRVVEKDQLLPEALHIAEVVLKGAPGAIRATKQLLDRMAPSAFSDDLKLAASFHHAARHSDEAKEGVTAFLEKRKPSWDKSFTQ